MAIISYGNPWYLFLFMTAAIIQLFLTSAPIFGFSSILIIFKEKKLYHQLCTFNKTATNSSQFLNPMITCNEQDKALNLFFAVGIIFHNGVKIFLGYMVDKIGGQICQYIGCVFILLFSFTLAYAEQGKEYLVFVSFILLALGSSILMLCCYQVANIIFRQNKAMYICIMSGSIDASTAVFILFLIAFDGGHSLLSISFTYGCIVVVFVITATSLLYPSRQEMDNIIDADIKMILSPTKEPKDFEKFTKELSASYHGGATSSYQVYKSAIQRNLLELSTEKRMNDLSLSLSRSMGFSYSASEFEDSVESAGDVLAFAKRGPYGLIKEHVAGYAPDEYSATKWNESTREESPLLKTAEKYFTNLDDVTLSSCFFSKLNFLYTACISLVMLKLIYFIGNIDKYFINITDEETARTYTRYFGLCQFLGIIMGPLVGLTFLKRGSNLNKSAEEVNIENKKSLILPSLLLTIFILLLDGLQLFEKLFLSIPLFLLYLIANGFMWCLSSSFYSLLFPPQFYCTLYGFHMVILGMFSFLQYPILTLEQKYYQGKQFWTNLIFMNMLSLTFALPLYLWYSCYKYRKQTVEITILQVDDQKL